MIGREKEIAILNELYDGNSAEMIAVYGRRRVGKTYLIDETFAGRITFRHAGLSPIEEAEGRTREKKGKLKDQLNNFYKSLILQGMKETELPQTWLDAFFLLERFLQEKDDGQTRQLIFLDEIQWLDTPKSGFMTGLEAFWNGWACHRHNVMLIVCGSSSSWILDKLINNYGGLYGRITYQIELHPFNLYECEKYFESKGIYMSRYDITQAYMSVGGIPYYLNYFRKGLSLAQNIQSLFFEQNAPLKNEFERLFSSLFANTEEMIEIVKAISSLNRGLTRKEISEITGVSDSGTFGQYLNALISSHFIIRYHSFGNSKKETFYKLVDPFCLFFLKFVEGSSEKKLTDWINVSDSQSVITWKGYAFENTCFNHIRQIKATLGISGVITEVSIWSKRGNEKADGTQIDMIIDRRDNVINMCEMKFYSDEFTVDKEYHFILERRKNLLKEVVSKKTTIHSTLITTFGLKHNEYYSDIVSTITLDDLFKSLS